MPIERGPETDLAVANKRTHPALYAVWKAMISRCHNPENKSFSRYGDRGIFVCRRWRYSFENFVADMGNRPSRDHQVERVNNDGPYSPENCVWADRSSQARNRRDTRWLTMGGKTRCLKEWSELTGIRSSTICVRLKAGWSVEEALSTDPRIYHNRTAILKLSETKP